MEQSSALCVQESEQKRTPGSACGSLWIRAGLLHPACVVVVNVRIGVIHVGASEMLTCLQVGRTAESGDITRVIKTAGVEPARRSQPRRAFDGKQVFGA